MHYHFRQAVIINGVRFAPGVREVPEKCENHPHFLKYVDCGWIGDAEQKATEASMSDQDRSKILLNRLIDQRAKKSAKAEAPVAAGVASTPAAPVAPEDAEQKAEAPAADDVGDFLDSSPHKSGKKKK